MNPIVLSSRKADAHFLKIKGEHSILLEGIAAQNQRLQALGEQRKAEKQNQDIVRYDREKTAMTTNVQTQKNALDFQTKQEELALKRAALSNV